MRILIVTAGFFPGKKYGGPSVSVDNFCALMNSYAECKIITLNHDLGEKSKYAGIHDGWNDRGNAEVLYVDDRDYNSRTFERVILSIHPDIIYLQGLFQECILPCLKLAKKHQIRVFLAPRGELCAGAFHKKYKKIPYIAVLHLLGYLESVVFQSTSVEETEAIAKYLRASNERIHLLPNIPSFPRTLPKRAEKMVGAGRFVFISRILWKKNLLKAIEFLKGIKGSVLLDIYGPKEEEGYWKECEKAIIELPENVKVNYRGVLSHDDIHKTFCQYDAFLFPTLSENYGHVIAESLVSGCVPIISDQTPWTDINEAGAGWALSLADEFAFRKAIQEVVDMDEAMIIAKRQAIELYLQEKLQLEKLKREYLAVFNTSVQN